MKNIILLILLVSTASVISQTKYLIYFKDKGIAPTNSLSKTSAIFKLAEKELSPQTIERRKQVMGEDNYITYEDVPLNENYLSKLESIGIKIKNKLRWFNAVSAYLTGAQINELKKLPFIEKIELVHIFKSHKEENFISQNEKVPRSQNSVQSSTGLNYGPSLTQNALSDIPAVHDLGITGNNVYIGILDNGFNWKTHASLSTRQVLKEYDYVDKDNNVSNADYHGTAVFSLMAGYAPGNLIGPAFDSKFYLARTENDASETHAEEDNYAAALIDMEADGVQITSSSLGYATDFTSGADYTFPNMDGQTTIVAKAINLAFERGVLSLTAIGNERGNNWNHIVSPADAINVIAVGAVNSDKTLSSYSSPGPTYDGRIKPEVCAMGTYPYHAIPNGYSNSGYGTSYATPIAAGVAALLKSCWPHLTNSQIRKIFLECGDNTASPNNDRGYGLISAKKTIAYPNLSKENNVYKILNKIFIDNNSVNSSTVRLNYKIGNGNYQNSVMNYDGSLKYSYILPTTSNGTTIEFYFTYQNSNGSTMREPIGSRTYIFNYGDTEIITDVVKNDEIPIQFYLSQNYPNPFNPSTIINWQLPIASFVTLKVYNILGREIKTLVNEFLPVGDFVKTFNGTSLPSGVYFYRIQAGEFSQTRKMILIK